MAGFEPTIFRSQTGRDARLRYIVMVCFQSSLSGLGGARILVSGASNRRYTVSATSPFCLILLRSLHEKTRCSLVNTGWMNRQIRSECHRRSFSDGWILQPRDTKWPFPSGNRSRPLSAVLGFEFIIGCVLVFFAKPEIGWLIVKTGLRTVGSLGGSKCPQSPRPNRRTRSRTDLFQQQPRNLENDSPAMHRFL